jgi:hypothetical protein
MCGNTQSTNGGREYPHNIPRNNRRFKNGVWQKPTAKGRGWTESVGLAGMTYEQGLKQIDYLNTAGGRGIVNVTTPDAIDALIPAVNVADLPTNPMHRRFNVALGIWEKPTLALDGWQPSGIADYSLEKGNAFLAQAVSRGHGYINIGPTEVAGEDMVPQADVTAFENFLNDGDVPNVRAGEGEFGIPFMPTLTVLPNGGITVTVDARGAISLARAVVATLRRNIRSQDSQYLAPLGAVLIRNESRLFTDAVETLQLTPFGE